MKDRGIPERIWTVASVRTSEGLVTPAARGGSSPFFFAHNLFAILRVTLLPPEQREPRSNVNHDPPLLIACALAA